MQKIEFGSTGLVIEKNGFGCLPHKPVYIFSLSS